jgi:hypothetical protein
VPARGGQKAAIQAAFEKCGNVYNFMGKPTKEHRMFVFSADTFMETPAPSRSTAGPWVASCQLTAAADPYIEWMLGQAGPSDILLFADGRSKQARKKLDAAVEKARNMLEMWVVFKPSPRLGRNVSFASDTREQLWVSLPVDRTKFATKARTTFASCGEASTHDSTYTGVGQMPWAAMPLVSSADKESILGVPPASPRGRVFDCSMGQPLFWQERKGVEFWMQIIRDFDVKAVYDCTPSSTLGRACMASGVFYGAAAKNEAHSSWLNNVFDREAAVLTTRQGSTLYEQDIATLLKNHFEDIIDEAKAREQCPDKAMDDDIDEADLAVA